MVATVKPSTTRKAMPEGLMWEFNRWMRKVAKTCPGTNVVATVQFKGSGITALLTKTPRP